MVQPFLILLVVFKIMDFGMGNQNAYASYYTSNGNDQTIAFLQLGQQQRHHLADEPDDSTSGDEPINSQILLELQSDNESSPSATAASANTITSRTFQFQHPQPPLWSAAIPRIPLRTLTEENLSLHAKIQLYEQEILERASQSLSDADSSSTINLEIINLASTAPVMRNSPPTISSSSTTSTTPPRLQDPKLIQNLILPAPRLTTNSTIIMLVLSAEYQYTKRQAIRETWGQGHDNVYFVIGHSNCQDTTTTTNNNDNNGGTSAAGGRGSRLFSKSKTTTTTTPPVCRQLRHMALYHEQVLYQDLLEVPMEEYYQGLPDKIVYSYQWTLQNLPDVDWMIKIDDDMFARVTSLEEYLDKYNPNHPMVIGQVIDRSPVNREGKWAERHYPPLFYPWWPQGSAGHVISRAIAIYVATHDAELFRYQGEDVSLGIWLQEATDVYHHLDHVTYIQASPTLISNKGPTSCANRKTLMVGHDFSVDGLQRCWAMADEVTPREKAYQDQLAPFRPYTNQYTSTTTKETMNSGGGEGQMDATTTTTNNNRFTVSRRQHQVQQQHLRRQQKHRTPFRLN
jgi:Galactosyltransferase